MVSAASAEPLQMSPSAMQRSFILPPRVVWRARGILPSCPVTTVFTAFEHTARAHGAKPFLQFYPDKLELSYAQARERIADVAGIYAGKGYAAGHRVGLKLPNCAEFLLHFLALNSLGISVVPMNPDYQRSEFEYVAAHSEAALVVDATALANFDPP